MKKRHKTFMRTPMGRQFTPHSCSPLASIDVIRYLEERKGQFIMMPSSGCTLSRGGEGDREIGRHSLQSHNNCQHRKREGERGGGGGRASKSDDGDASLVSIMRLMTCPGSGSGSGSASQPVAWR